MVIESILAAAELAKSKGANEAETRLKIIDRVLFEILDWTHADVTVEDRVSEDGETTWSDYILRTGMTAVVVEAKKSGISFATAPDVRRVKLTRKLLESDLGDAIVQARDYARKLSVPFAVATNGDAWVIFPATRTDQVSFHDSSAIVFPSLKAALGDLIVEFKELLSRSAVINGILEADLLGRIENQIEERRIGRYFNASLTKKTPGNLFPLIETAVITAFTEDVVSEDEELLAKLYVRTPERIRFDNRISMHIVKREQPYNRPAKRPLRRDGAVLTDLIQGAASRARPVAILVLGTVGSGKSTFLQFTRKVASKELFVHTANKQYPHWIYVDLRDFSATGAILPFLYSALKEYINSDSFLSDYERCLKFAYRQEIDALFRGPLFLVSKNQEERERRISNLLSSDYEATIPYVDKVLRYASTKSPIFLVIDNVDQFEEDEFQADVFSEAVSISHKLGLNLVCALRESTYITHRNSPSFDAFDFDPIVIDPPDVQSVLSKRFFLTRELVRDKTARFSADNGAEVTISDLSIVIEMIQQSVLGTEIGNLISVLATSDVRLALRMTREFLQSGYSASGRAYTIYQQTGRYVFPPHEALRAIMLGNQTVYSERYSVIANPFDSRLQRSEAQLLRLYILSSLVQHSSSSSFQRLSADEIKLAVRQIGFGDEITSKVLKDLHDARFILTTSHSVPTLLSAFFPTRLGGYIVRQLLSEMAFVENVLSDTFISDTEVWNRIRELTEQIYGTRNVIAKLNFRINRVEIFMSF